ncbi:MAG: hypothetical protein EBR88_06820 [Betaproteobacteria bacterium]|nr:hypothetical protein [Betaproteobacteria bacterium]
MADGIRVGRAVHLLLLAARVSPPLLEAAKTVEDEIERLQRWKAEATTVLKEWDCVAEQIIQGLDFDDTVGRRKTDIVADEIERLRTEVDVRDEALMSCLRDGDRVRELIEHERQARREQ